MEADTTSPPSIRTVAELTGLIKEILEGELGHVLVRGEISNFHRHFSGHCYFTLKDERAQLQAVMFRREVGRLRFEPGDGLEVIAGGRISVYEARGQYQIVLDSLEPAGLGALQLAFEQLKEKLAREGLFAEGRKKKLPAVPRRIGIVTSPTGAALRDFLKVHRRRFAGVGVLVYPSPVQGKDAPRELIRGIRALDAIEDVDVLVLVRGGGSIEDLWAFNDEGLARAIAAAKKPVVTGVGHEVDFTIADFVADVRAPTPSAAAEIVVGNRADWIFRIRTARDRLYTAAATRLRDLRTRIELNRRALGDPAAVLRERRMRIDDLSLRLSRATGALLQSRRDELRRFGAQLDALSPLGTLGRGYAVVLTLPEERVLRDSRKTGPGDSLLIRLARGSVLCRVTGKDAEPCLPFEDPEGDEE